MENLSSIRLLESEQKQQRLINSVYLRQCRSNTHNELYERGKYVNSYFPYSYKQKSYAKILIVLLVLILPSCNYYQEFSQPKITTLLPQKQNKIRTIAILPFNNHTENTEIPDILRSAVFSNLSLKDYDLIKLNQINQKLKIASYHTTKDIGSIEHYKLGKLLGADALLYGTVTQCSKMFGVVYSRITIGAEMEMIEASTSKVIWKASHVELTHSGTPPFSPFSIPEKIVDSTINIRDKVIADTADKLAQKIVNGIPECCTNDFLSEPVVMIKNVGNKKVVYYKVQKDDTLFKISRKFYGHSSMWKKIKSANKEIESDSLSIGQDLLLPGVPVINNLNDAESLDKEHYKKAVYEVRYGDSLYSLASTLYDDGAKWRIIYEENKGIVQNTEILTVGQVLIIPLDNYVKQISKVQG